jgi:hypothetical protein
MTRADDLKRAAAATVLVAAIPLRAVFHSGIPWNVRLRLLLHSAEIRRQRDAARARLRRRLDEVQSMFALQRIGTQTVDKAVRARRFTLLPAPERPAMDCSMNMTCYFVSPVDIHTLLPQIIERVGIGDLKDKPPWGPNRRLSLEEGVHLIRMEQVRDTPVQVRPGPVSLTAGPVAVHDSVDWEIPGRRSIVDRYEHQWKRRSRPDVIRFKLSWQPAYSEVQRLRRDHTTVLAWTVWTGYYVRPKNSSS